MKIRIPDELKATIPHTLWGRILAATPVVMTVLATMLAGMASSEMTRAQYNRSIAAQQQSKAGDQWSFFQAKRLRSATQRNTLDLLQGIVDLGSLNPLAMKQSVLQLPGQLDQADAQVKEAMARMIGRDVPVPQKEAMEQYLRDSARRQAEAKKIMSDLLALLGSADATALETIQRAEMPDIGPAPALDANLKAAVEAIESSKSEKEIAPLISRIDDKALDEALRAAKDRTSALDAATKPFNQAIDRIEKLLARQATLLQEAQSVSLPGGGTVKVARSPQREFTAARLRYAAARYDSEARLNQAIANLYELQVRRSNATAERHHRRSQRFFYGMLAGQMAVIIATFAIAARKRNLLWSLAATAGLIAVAFGAYVYLYV